MPYKTETEIAENIDKSLDYARDDNATASLKVTNMNPLNNDKKYRILFVCLGNICRSPAAEGIFRSIVERNGDGDAFMADSAGTYSGHRGELPDRRMRSAAGRRGYELTHRSRPVNMTDFFDFDIIIAMDDNNFTDLMHMAPSVETSRKIKKMSAYFSGHSIDYVPDPYYMGADGFELVLDLLEDACMNLYRDLKNQFA